jgi:hypothetical protein
MPGAHERGLARPRWADDRERTARYEPIETGGDVGSTAEEAVRVLLLVGQQAEVRAGRCHLRQGVGACQFRILAQDRHLERDEIGPGVDAELLGQLLACTPQRAQRLTLMAGLVLRLGQQRPPPFPQRCLGDASRAFGEDLAPAPDPEERLQAEVLRDPTELVQPRSLEPRGFPALEPLERRTAPERQSIPGARGGSVVLAEREELPGPLDGPLEPAGVDGVVRQREAVAVVNGVDQGGTQPLAQPCDAALDDLGGRRRRVVAPERIGELIPGDVTAAAYGQRREDDAVARTEPGGLAVQFEWPQHPDSHDEPCAHRRAAVKSKRS